MLRLRRAPKRGGAREDVTSFDPTVATAPGKPLVTATGGGYVYWAASGKGIFRCLAAGGCGTSPERIVPTPDRHLHARARRLALLGQRHHGQGLAPRPDHARRSDARRWADERARR